MHTITADTIGEGHEKVVKLIMGTDEFLDITTEDGELTFEYPTPVNIHINHPWKSPLSSPSLMFGQLSLDEYKEQMLTIKRLVDKPGAPAFSYLYSNLIFDFPKEHMFLVHDENKKLMRADWYRGNGRGDGTNQVQYVIDKLSASPTSRRAVISLFEPCGHPQMDDPPCLNHIQFMIRGGSLNMHALFRSNDMLSAWGGNAYALMHLQKYVLERVKTNIGDRFDGNEKLSMGSLETTSISAHVYFKRDQNELDKFRARWH
jgi:thymidylate synthase